MDQYSNGFDVAGSIKTTEPLAVKAEVSRIFHDLYPNARTDALNTAFNDAAAMYRGEFPGLMVCDTAYHDIQHVLDVTLAMARLIDGYERGRIGTESINERLFHLGVITALFHDIGYLRRGSDDKKVTNGAEFTLIHVSRGAQFLREYMPRLGMPDMANVAAALIHFTGYERPVASIEVPGLIYRLLGNLLGSADIIAQMADRCYLEKCRDRLYPEFLAGGLTTKRDGSGNEITVFSSGEDLVRKTPLFYAKATHRLQHDLGRGYEYAESYFHGQNLYIDKANKNIRFAEQISTDPELSALRRQPPDTIAA